MRNVLHELISRSQKQKICEDARKTPITVFEWVNFQKLDNKIEQILLRLNHIEILLEEQSKPAPVKSLSYGKPPDMLLPNTAAQFCRLAGLLSKLSPFPAALPRPIPA